MSYYNTVKLLCLYIRLFNRGINRAEKINHAPIPLANLGLYNSRYSMNAHKSLLNNHRYTPYDVRGLYEMHQLLLSPNIQLHTFEVNGSV